MRLTRQAVIESQTTPENRGHPLHHPRTDEPERRRRNDQNQERANLARTRDLPLLARPFEASCRRRFGSFEVAFLSHFELPVYSRLL
jgi:hypothetical protein